MITSIRHRIQRSFCSNSIIQWPPIGVVRKLATCGMVLLTTACGDQLSSEPPLTDAAQRQCVNQSSLRNPYFGETHVHTMRSVDAYSFDIRLTPADAFRFARGQEVGITPYDAQGQPMRTTRLDRPLDWAMLSDHSEFFGEVAICNDPSLAEYQSPGCQSYREQSVAGHRAFLGLWAVPQDNVHRMPFCGEEGELCVEHSNTVMQEQVDAAEAANDLSDECRFTAFVGYEWSGNPQNLETREIQNIHRNVLFANEKVPKRPSSYLDAPYPEDLWGALSADCREGIPGCDVLTIPHNSNLSAGLMFRQLDKYGQPFSADYARRRASFEPIIELIQHKGSSECWPGSSDPECRFETLPWSHLAGNRVASGDLPEGLLPLGKPRENAFVRNAWKEGLVLEKSLGSNPFKFGVFGATDTHMAAPGMVAEDTFPGHRGSPNPGEVWDLDKQQFLDDPHHNPGGLSVVWAEQNTRASLFAAMKRREVYGTSGPRHVLRFFGGWNYDENLCNSPELVQAGYEQGVPMGSDLPARDGAAAPRFVVSALKDSGGRATDLQRVQIIKGWVDDNGAHHEQVYEVAGNAANGAGVDLNTCSSTGAGSSNLCTVWVDPEFNPQHSAFYYTRVLENPSCRWTTFQCLEQGVICSDPASGPADMRAVCCDAKSPATHPEMPPDYEIPQALQERSWSSPIWYRPDA